jgi:hypothetical protein
MRQAFSERVERGRWTEGPMATPRGSRDGMFSLRTNDGQEVRVMASQGGDEVPWEHVSVSTKTRCPTWKEMCWIKDLFFEDEEVVIQYHPRKSDYVNLHPFCLHLWRPLATELPTPPPMAAGPRTAEEKAVTDAIYRGIPRESFTRETD